MQERAAPSQMPAVPSKIDGERKPVNQELPANASKISRWTPYLWIVLCGFFCHAFILTNDGPIWDGWYWLDWLTKHNWAPMVEYNYAQGLPFILYILASLALAPDIVLTGVILNFVCLLVESIVFYRLVLRLVPLHRSEALAVTLLAGAMPSFSAAQDFPVLALIFYRMLFLVGALLAVLAIDSKTSWRWVFRAAALMALIVSCVTNGALMPYYGGFYVLLVIRHWKAQLLPFLISARRFGFRYPDLFLLPPAALAIRLWLIPQFGWYQNYNKPIGSLSLLGTNLWSFVENVLFFHIERTAGWFLEHPIVTILTVIACIFFGTLAPSRMWGQRSAISSIHYAWFGALLLFLAVFPLAVAGKYFAPMPVGETSRHSMLTQIPLAILLFAAIRPLLFMKRKTASPWMVPAVASGIIILGSQFFPIYLNERVEWIFSRSLLHNAVRDPVVRNSSVVLLQNFSVARQFIYSIHGFASAFGDLTRLVTCRIPENGRFYTAQEIQRVLFWTSMLPSEFNRVNPAGQQILLEGTRNRGSATDLEIVTHYFSLRCFGTRDEMDQFLASLTNLKTTVLKPATPLIPGPAQPAPNPPPTTIPVGEFTNGAGMRLVFLSWGLWAGKFETTQDQYERLMGSNPSLFKDPVRPVECVSWHQANEFCRRLTELEAKAGRLPRGYVYRLPTADEFDRLLLDGALHNTVTSAEKLQWQTAPVGSRPPNALGLNDTVGNVWEWCLDWWDDAHRFKISKGGSWVNPAWELAPYPAKLDPLDWLANATADRMFGPVRRDYPNVGFWDRGFRCMLAPESSGLDSFRGSY